MVKKVLKKKLFVRTYGCQMNVYDSDRMADILAPLGYEPTEQVGQADMVILNTCHIREKAAEKVYSELGRMRSLKANRKADGQDMILAVAGCVAQAEGEEMLRRAPYVDMVVGPQSYHRLPELIAQLSRQGNHVLDTDFPVDSKFDHLPRNDRASGPAAFLSVQEGCDRFCTFCVVPYTRGAEFSRPVDHIVAEAQDLRDGGVREITLLGQNVNAFHGLGPDGKDWGLGRLIRELARIEGIERLRYTTSHPRDMDDALIEAHAEVAELMPYLHLPVQSGSDGILTAMNRRHSADDYRRIVDRLRRAVPDIALSSDFIVGFPGESDQDFADTLRLVTEMNYAQAYSFKYSARPGTPAAVLDNQVPEAVKSERLAMLQELLNAQQMAFNQACIGRTLPVLLERRGRDDNQLVGRSPYMQAVHLSLPAVARQRMMGTIQPVVISAAHPNSLSGRVALDAAAFDGGGGTVGPNPASVNGTLGGSA